MKPTVIAVVGPTASGKTRLGAALAKALVGEVISFDSMQIYEGMDVATAKPTEEEMLGVPHHLIGFLPPDAAFSAAQFKTLCTAAVNDVLSRGKVPVLVGGTGLYFDTIYYNTTYFETADASMRETLTARLQTQGAKALLSELREIDPETAAALHPSDEKRILRALEVYYATGRTISEQKRLSRLQASPYAFCVIGLCAEDRAFLYDRIDRRVDAMLEQGLLQEARHYYENAPAGTAKQAIGYKELKPYFDGQCTLDAALDRLRMETRRYAKRQLTWFRRNKAIRWLQIDRLSAGELLSESLEIIRQETGLTPPKEKTDEEIVP
ncbi:MAG: tRNA (adenosine(37)-N6)-dimethylallyltransferase MiaA [Clostridia bacterium]|nr:tRNA (adenosine(37)-N6)-dimethylallyltransferase MiaA [Clostridia bacterium]